MGSKAGFRKLLNQDITVRRKTDILRATEGITASMSLGTQPSQAVKLFATVAGGTTGSGTLTINGTVNGVADSENLVFTNNGFKESSKLFTEVTSITESGFTDETTVPTLEIKAKSGAGQPIYQEVLQFGRRARIQGISGGKIGKYTTFQPGKVEDSTHFLFTTYSASEKIQEKDVITDVEGNRYEVLPFDVIDSGGSLGFRHHLEISLKSIL